MKILKYFRSGGVIYGLAYTANRGSRKISGAINYLIHRWAFGKCGMRLKIGSGVFIASPRNIFLGDDVFIGDNCRMTTEIADSKLFIENNVQLSGEVKIDYSGGIVIKNGCLLSQGVRIITHDHGHDPRSKPVANSLLVEQNVWLGLNVTVLPGVKRIGHDSIIGVGTILTTEVPPCSIVAGVPGKIVKTR